VINEAGEAIGGLGSAGTIGCGGYRNTHNLADPEEYLIGTLM
jgi:hypothetical protein